MLKQQDTSIFKNLSEGNWEEWTEKKTIIIVLIASDLVH